MPTWSHSLTLDSLTLDGPEAITLSGAAVTRDAQGNILREARLLVAGDYPGKDLRVTEADLDALVSNFSAPVPVKVEHIDSPLDPLGEVVSVRRDGGELRGTIRFPATLAAFLSERGAAKLSCGLLKEPAWRLLEASLTLTPHVPGATLLSAPKAELSDGERAELARLRESHLTHQLTALKAAGKIVPASEPLARALLSGPAVVTLSGGSGPEPLADVFRRFLEAQPPVVHLSEVARAQAGPTTLNGGAAGAAAVEGEDDPPAFTEEQAAILARIGVAPADVRETLRAERAATRAASGANTLQRGAQ